MIYTIKTQDLTGNTIDKGVTGIEFDLETIDTPAGFSQITIVRDFNIRIPVTLVTDDLREILDKLNNKLNTSKNDEASPTPSASKKRLAKYYGQIGPQ